MVNCILWIFPDTTNYRRTPKSDLFNTQQLIQKTQYFIRSATLPRKGNKGGGEGVDKGVLCLLHTGTCCSLVYTPWKAFDELILLSSISLSSFISLSTKPWLISKAASSHLRNFLNVGVSMYFPATVLARLNMSLWRSFKKLFHLQSESLVFLFWSIFIQPQSSTTCESPRVPVYNSA